MAEVRLPCSKGKVTNLPPVCMYCGHPASLVKGRQVYSTAFLQKVLVRMPLCDRHRISRTPARFLAMMIWMSAVGTLLNMACSPLLACAWWLGSIVTWIAFGIGVHLFVSIRATQITGNSVTLCNVAERFAERAAECDTSSRDAVTNLPALP